MNRKASIVALVLVGSLLAAACAQSLPVGTPEPTVPPGLKGIPARAGWQEKWDNTVALARKEGEVVYYTTAAAETRTAIAEAMNKKFGIGVEFVTGRGPELSARLQKEYSGGVFIADVVNSGGGTFTGLKQAGLLGQLEPLLVLPDVLEPKSWITGGVPFIDRERMFIGMLAVYEKYVARNTDLVKEGEIASYKDLLNPKWKGKMALFDPTATGSGASMVTFLARLWGLDRTKEFLMALANQDLGLTRDKRLHAEWTAKGKYAISLAPNPEMMAEFIDLKLPLAHVKIEEGGMVNTVGGAIGITAKPAHPNASQVFINWMLSKEGHGVYVSSVKLTGARVDAPTDGIDKNMIARPGDKFIQADEEFFILQRDVINMTNQIFGALMK
ncbi:MAG: ABC transporter substrate-binding protein [Chloroflexi bacterium]|nr:ABC transporter substrate-binding protein [Chloroflexota bacterium]